MTEVREKAEKVKQNQFRAGRMMPNLFLEKGLGRKGPIVAVEKRSVRQGKLVQFSRFESCPAKV